MVESEPLTSTSAQNERANYWDVPGPRASWQNGCAPDVSEAAGGMCMPYERATTGDVRVWRASHAERRTE
ncbi:MAG: hypothetical protein KatS3mg038_3341 [Candidatus Kapaibacterium sp.]|nr:MAG: hypothetical protein KatS3mg038_1484 [Candidatus Kapabacteria bacterium]GIV52674.1 MAG: hypothetical protein KatS3mg038_3195 [Candidatus Kapabacteria bacterium]GIV52820.1 MAG: hypothetical protein KatS3mg038_3341 [Candidatus Kapabacteria bacterium]